MRKLHYAKKNGHNSKLKRRRQKNHNGRNLVLCFCAASDYFSIMCRFVEKYSPRFVPVFHPSLCDGRSFPVCFGRFCRHYPDSGVRRLCTDTDDLCDYAVELAVAPCIATDVSKTY